MGLPSSPRWPPFLRVQLGRYTFSPSPKSLFGMLLMPRDGAIIFSDLIGSLICYGLLPIETGHRIGRR